MNRRALLATAAAATLASPRAVRAAGSTTLRFIPQADLSILDPHVNTAYVTRNHGYMVYDTLYGTDAQYRVSGQMVEGHTTEDEGRRWTLTLRPGLLWHDGTPVLARDCVASIRRWGARDTFGQTLLAATDSLDAPDDRRIVFRLRQPFPLLPEALAKTGVYMPAMMPERLARTDPATPIIEIIGSGPFRWKPDERIPGARAVWERNPAYVPLPNGTPSYTAGPKVVKLDRVEWTTIPDGATAAAALQNNEQDWWESTTPDLNELLRRNRAITVESLDSAGTIGMLRPNHLQPPFDNPAIRRAVLHALDQNAMMQVVIGDDPTLYNDHVGVFMPGSPMANTAGLDAIGSQKNDLPAVAKALKDAGYKGETVELIVPTDYLHMRLMGEVVADTMRRAGMTVNYVATDWATMLQRRTNKGPVGNGAGQGGWSGFITSWTGSDWLNPATHISLHGNGLAGYPGWSTSEKTESLIAAWFDAPTLEARQAICRDIQVQSMEDVPFFPLGQFAGTTAHRNLTGVLRGFATFWNVRSVG